MKMLKPKFFRRFGFSKVLGRSVLCLTAPAAILCIGVFPALTYAQCSLFDFEFVGTSPPVPNSAALLFLHVRNGAIRFTANDSLGDTDTGEASPAHFNCFKSGGVTSCSTFGVDRVTFTWTASGQTVQGDVLLAGYRRAVVDVIRSNARHVRYLLKPCSCITGETADVVAVLPQAGTPKIAPLRPATLVRQTANTPADSYYVWRVLAPDVSARRAAHMADQIFGFSGMVRETAVSFTLREEDEPGRALLLYKSSGVMEFWNPSKYRVAAYRPTLPDASSGIILAQQFLATYGLLPPNAQIDTRVETLKADGNDVDNALAITFEAHLPVNSSTLAPIRDGEVVVWLGHMGEVIRLHKNYREVDPAPIPVAHEPIDRITATLAADVTTLSGLLIQPVYLAFDPEEEQTYLDPVVEATDTEQGLAAARARATLFTPILSFLGPDPSVQVPFPGATQLSASATDGSPPYSFFWYSSIDGMLGEGADLPVQLSAGQHRIDLTVRDSNGAGISGSLLLNVAPGSTTLTAEPEVKPLAAQAVPNNTRIDAGNGVSFTVVSDEARPIILNQVDKGGIPRARNIYFDQFWYEIDVSIAGSTFTLNCRKCVARTTAGVDACDSPRAPFAQSNGSSTLMYDASSGTVSTTVTINNLPGTLRLKFEYAAVSEYCGPEPGFFQKSGLFLANVGGLAYPLGGQCAGLRPTVKWTYEPPCDKSLSGADIQAFCEQDGADCDIPSTTLAALDKTRRYFIRDFRSALSTAVQPPAGQDNDVSSLVKDGSDVKTLGATDGAINRTLQPYWAPPDAFVYIDPITNEKSVVASNMSSRGAWDNVHIKEGPSLGVYFPGCNNPQTKGVDQQPCIHLHENWLNKTPGINQTYSKGQLIVWYLVLFRTGGEESPNHPSTITNGEALTTPFRPGVQQALWVESVARSIDCAPTGAVRELDNSTRACVVFPQAMFFTPR
jgi:hypothetical protein